MMGSLPSESSSAMLPASENSQNVYPNSSLANSLKPVKDHVQNMTCSLETDESKISESSRSDIRSRSHSLQSNSEYPKKSSRVGDEYQATDLPPAISNSDHCSPDNTGVTWQPLWNPNLEPSSTDDHAEDNLTAFLQVCQNHRISEEAALYHLLCHDGDTCKATSSLRIKLEWQPDRGVSTSTSTEGEKGNELEAWLSITHRPKEWTPSEEDIFAASIVSTLKDFGKVARELEGRTQGDCIHYYYSRFKRRRGVRTRQSNLSNRRRPLETQNIQPPSTSYDVTLGGIDNGSSEYHDALRSDSSQIEPAKICEVVEGGYQRLKKAMAKRNRVQFEEENRNVTECTACNEGGSLLCCDTCSNAYHLTCLDPPLSKVPEGDWICPACHRRREKRAAAQRANSELAALRQAAAVAVRDSRIETAAVKGSSNEILSVDGSASDGKVSFSEVYRLPWPHFKELMLLDGWCFLSENVCGNDEPLGIEASTHTQPDEMLLSWHTPPVAAQVIARAKARDQWEQETWLTVHKGDGTMETVTVHGSDDSRDSNVPEMHTSGTCLASRQS